MTALPAVTTRAPSGDKVAVFIAAVSRRNSVIDGLACVARERAGSASLALGASSELRTATIARRMARSWSARRKLIRSENPAEKEAVMRYRLIPLLWML